MTTRRFLIPLALLTLILFAAPLLFAESGESTRVEDPEQHAFQGGGGYPFRTRSDYVMQELDLKPGDVVADIGAGDGVWSAHFAEAVGEDGVVHAGEVAQGKVDGMIERFEDTPQVKPYLCPFENTGLEEDSLDLLYLSKTYHHIEADIRVDYWNHLRDVVKPTGRVAIIEHYQKLAQGRMTEHAYSPGKMIMEAEEAGWICVRSEIMTGTHHFIAIFVQAEMFPREE
jgi:arsenite methyltransferase